jgi:hypothetical protein
VALIVDRSVLESFLAIFSKVSWGYRSAVEHLHRVLEALGLILALPKAQKLAKLNMSGL